jgi:uncharacterized membrane protein YfcA
LAVGFINTLGGGGSSLIYPLLIFMGFSPHEAIGTARPAYLMQGFFGWLGFKSKKFNIFPFNVYVALAATAGSVIGAYLSLEVPPLIMKKIIAAVITMVTVYILFSQKTKPGSLRRNISYKPGKIFVNLIIFFLLGIYSGFIQTGLGFLILISLVIINRINITRANSIKAMVILLSGIPSLIIFAQAGMVHWKEAFFLATGTAVGAWLTSRWSVKANQKLVKIIIGGLTIFMAVKLWIS